ncbi:MAG: class I SAM-dependent methyltransferase [Acidimicrobiia bacterium]
MVKAELRRVAASLPGIRQMRSSARYQNYRLRTRPGPEDRFTKPSEDCPYPGRWTSTDGQSTEVEVVELVAAFIRALQPDFVLETGTAFGASAAAIGRSLVRNGQGRLVTLEVDSERVRRARLATRRLPVEVLQIASLDYVPGAWIDFAWFDSLVKLRTLEFRRFLPYMHAGTVVGFHDSGSHYNLRDRIDALVEEGLLRTIDLPTPRGVTFGQPLHRPPRSELSPAIPS